MIWTLLGFFMFLATGILTIMTWSGADIISTSSNASEVTASASSFAIKMYFFYSAIFKKIKKTTSPPAGVHPEQPGGDGSGRALHHQLPGLPGGLRRGAGQAQEVPARQRRALGAMVSAGEYKEVSSMSQNIQKYWYSCFLL